MKIMTVVVTIKKKKDWGGGEEVGHDNRDREGNRLVGPFKSRPVPVCFLSYLSRLHQGCHSLFYSTEAFFGPPQSVLACTGGGRSGGD